MFKKIFGLAVVLSLIVTPLLALGEVLTDEISEEDELIEISIGEESSLTGINCFDYYHFNSVEIELGLGQEVLMPDQKMIVSATLRNHNDYPLVDGGLFIQVFRNKTDGLSNTGNYLVDEFWATKDITLNALSEKQIGFDWQASAGLAGGSYFMVGHFLISEKMNLSGLSFTEGVHGGLSDFTFEEVEVNEVYFDKETVLVGSQPFQARGFIPTVEEEQVELFFNLKSLSAQDRTVTMIEKLYHWDSVGPDQLIWEKESEISVGAGQVIARSQAISDLVPGVYLFEAQTDQSILKVRFVVNGSDAPARFNFLALNDFPIKGNQANSFFVCFHNTNDFHGTEGRIEVLLEDEIGNEISRWDYEGEITPSIMAGLSEFTTRRDYNQVWLRGKLYQNDQLIDQVDLFYDINLFTDMADLRVEVQGGQLIVGSYDMAGRLTDTRLAVEIKDQDGNLVYFNPSYYGSDLREDVDFIAGHSYQVKILAGSNSYQAEYVHKAGSAVWFWLIGLAALLIVIWLLFKGRKKSAKPLSATSMALMGLILVTGMLMPFLAQASQQSFIDRIISGLGSYAQRLELSTIPRFQAGELRDGSVTVNTKTATQRKTSVLEGRSAICNNIRHPQNNPCHRIYESGFSGGRRVFARHIGLGARINFTNDYPIYLIDIETGERINGGDILGVGDILRIELGEPEGEWFFTGSVWDTPPIDWVDNAENDYNQLTSIDNEYLTPYQINARSLGVNHDNIFNPQIGAAATNPLTLDQVEVSVTDNLITYREGSYHYVEVVGPGIGEIRVEVPESFIYATIDNLWFQGGNFPAATKVTAIGAVLEEETLTASLSANPASGNAPLTIDLTASISPDSTAIGPANFTFWCDCDYVGADIEGAINQCGNWIHRMTGLDADSYVAEDVCTYGSAGDYTPKVIIERGLAEAAQAQVTDLRVSEIETSKPRVEDLTMDPNTCTNDCRSCPYPTQPTLYWKFVSDDGFNQSAFEIQFATNDAFNNYIPVTNGWINSNSEAYAIPINYLNYGKEYRWRIRVKDSQSVSSDWFVYEGIYVTPANPYPEPDFSWEPEPPVLEEETQFTDNSRVYGGSSSYVWTFPEAKITDGEVQYPLTLTDRNPLVIFSGTASQRSVKMIVTDGAGLYCDLTKAVPTTGVFGLPGYEEVAP